jgi:uncharacterized protein
VIDRVTPTYRPLGWPIGHQRWRDLLFLHWSIPANALRPLVPPGLTLDLWEGMAYISIVSFAVSAARPPGVPAALGLRFLETNVRTYVHVDGRDPGVYFFSLDATSALAVAGARLGLGLPYIPAQGRMRHQGPLIEYAMERRSPSKPHFSARYQPGAPLGCAPPGSLEHFLVERYLLHVERHSGLWTLQVHHRPYPVHDVRVHQHHEELIASAGLLTPVSPPTAQYATQVDIDIFSAQCRDGTTESDQERRHASS